MKKWNAPVVAELEINKTEFKACGQYTDGGYIGDGILSGHLTNDASAATDTDPSIWDKIVGVPANN